MGRKGLAPPNKQAERNEMVISAIESGKVMMDIARAFGISRQRVTQIWQAYGAGDNLVARRHKRRQQDEQRIRDTARQLSTRHGSETHYE